MKFGDQELFQEIVIAGPGPKVNILTDLPDISVGDAYFPRAVGFLLSNGAPSVTGAGFVFFGAALCAIQQTDPASLMESRGILHVQAKSFGATGTGAVGLSEFESPFVKVLDGRRHELVACIKKPVVVIETANITLGGTVKLGVFLRYDIVTLNLAERAALACAE